MEPNNPYPQYNPPTNNQQPVSGPNPYDFILNSSGTKKKFFRTNNTQNNFYLVIFGLVGLIVLLFVLSSVFSSPPLINTVDVTNTLQVQQEIIHLTSFPTNNNVTSPDISDSLNYSNSTVGIVIASQQSALISYLKGINIVINSSTIALGISNKLDNQLSTALSGGNFDSIFKQDLINQINIYKTSLATTFSTSRGIHGKALLSNDYKSLSLLLNALNQS